MQIAANPMTNARMIFAKARDGLDLPVIDVTNPRFAVPDDPASLAAQRKAFLDWYRHQSRMSRFIMRWFFRRAARRSRLVRALFQADKGYLDSITTYILKLGVDNLPRGFDGPVDRRMAASPHVILVRLRMQQVARLLADALVDPLAADAAAPLQLINIAGGPALDSINALILLKRDRPDLLRRPIAIEVLDAQSEGPAFGANALAALQQADGPLQGVVVEFRHRSYDWNEPTLLEQMVAQLRSRGAIVAASSEGGLFEYGSDAAIIANLRALAAKGKGVKIVAGSVTAASPERKRMIAQSTFKLHPRGIEGFGPLAAQAGYATVKNEPTVFSDQVLLRLQNPLSG
jgi:hypothetical protein